MFYANDSNVFNLIINCNSVLSFKEFKGESAVETKVLGLLNNIAEVPHLRSHLMSSEFLFVLRFDFNYFYHFLIINCLII